MLVLSRKPGEKITVGSDVVITVLGSTASRIKIGVEAPDHVRVMRAELAVQEKCIEPEVVSEQTIRRLEHR